MSETELLDIEALCAKATPGPWETSVSPTRTTEEAIEHMAQHIRAAPGVEVFGVWCPEHEGTVIGEDRARPVHAVHAAKTGNGPNSAANADFIAAARSAVPLLLAEIRRLQRLAP